MKTNIQVCPYDAYLAEVRSIGGLSGSPVLLHIGIGRGNWEQRKTSQVTGFNLLGVVRSHWDMVTKAEAKNTFAAERKDINMGIAMVTPIQTVTDILYREDLVKERGRLEGEDARRRAPVPPDFN